VLILAMNHLLQDAAVEDLPITSTLYAPGRRSPILSLRGLVEGDDSRERDKPSCDRLPFASFNDWRAGCAASCFSHQA